MARVIQAVKGAGRPVSRRHGFTLVEVLLVLAIMALFATLFIPGVNAILREMDARGPEQIVSETILTARGAALESGRTVALRYDADGRRFLTDEKTDLPGPLPATVKLELLPPETGATVLLGGQLVETDALHRIRFFPDGTCDPFRVRLQQGAEPPRLLLADPWTCALSPVAPKP
jgi:type II secretion system protein H